MLIASQHYFALSGDRGFLDSAYSMLLTSANYILQQRDAGGAQLNPHRLVWCTSTETFVRGLCTWRNCFNGGRISGAVTEINSECVMALRAVADLASHVGDEANANRLNDSAEDLRRAINAHLKSTTPNNPFYLLMIDPFGERDDSLTGDLLFPVLCDVAEPDVSQKILAELFGPRFWVTSPSGAAGMRTVAPGQPLAAPKADPGNYGLTGGVWPNLALWAGRAAAQVGRTDLLVQALRGTMLLSDREDFDRFNVTPGEFPEYYNGDDLVQRGNLRSTFIHGSYSWAAIEGIMGLRPRAAALEVNPQLPRGWKWAAITNMPYRGFPLSMIASAENHTLYTSTRVETDWEQVICPLSLQEQYQIDGDGATIIGMIVTSDSGREAVVASDAAATVRVRQRDTGRVVAEVRVAAGDISRIALRS
jgi:glycogen debranching enzyme